VGPAGASSGGGVVDLLGPVLLPNFVESRQVDSQLLVVPVAVCTSPTTATAAAATSATATATTTTSSSFPSLQQMQADDAAAKEAKKYLRKLLRQVLSRKGSQEEEETMKRLRDINLLLYLSLLLDEPVFDLLCEHLRTKHTAGKKKGNYRPLPVEVAVSLENLVNAL